MPVEDREGYRQVITSRLKRLRIRLQRANKLVHGRYWFPHVPLAIMLAFAGLLVLRASFGTSWAPYLHSLSQGEFHLRPRLLPALLIGLGMLTMAVGLLWRSRVSWLMALLLAITAALDTLLGSRHPERLLVAYFVIILVGLLFAWRHFDRSSMAASTLFALTSVAMLLIYATFGAYYLG